MTPFLIADRADILVLDDQVENLQALVNLLSPEFNVHPFSNGQALLRYVRSDRLTDLILLDIVMPEPDGYAVCAALRTMPDLVDVPIVFLSGLSTPEDEAKGLALGAVDYISKPFSPAIVLSRVRSHVQLGRMMRLVMQQNERLDSRVAERTAALATKNTQLVEAMDELAKTKDATILALSSLAETRDSETGHHIRRTQSYVRVLAEALSQDAAYAGDLQPDTIDLLHKSAALHDIGKVAIPDHILLKPGRLTPEEFAVMKTHTEHGSNALASAEESVGGNSFLKCAREIAHFHHERWDGKGYPVGLQGTQIPLPARLMAVADVYDALISPRVYKRAMSHHRAVELILADSGQHFDPVVVRALVQRADEFKRISERFRDVVANLPTEAQPDLAATAPDHEPTIGAGTA